jgi:formylglycine-generating enzyme required for sulfatase activity
MTLIPGGRFVMGNNASSNEADKPEHEETVASFFLDRNEVTVEEYYQFIKARNHTPPKTWSREWREGKFNGEEGKLPVTGVTWLDAGKYADWAGKRLPTEIEWEYAARGADKRLYPWGQEFDQQRANVGDPARKTIQPVGKYPQDKSPLDLLNMAGNVREWTASDFMRYPDKKNFFAAGKVIRGGSFLQKRTSAQTSARFALALDEAGEDIGFRCAKSVARQ